MKNTYDFDIGILGAGSAGLTVAAGTAQLGAKTLLVEKEKHLGGDCLHYGCVPSKTLIRTATIYHYLKQAKKFGLPQVDVPPVDFRAIARRIQDVIGTIQKHDSVERFCGLGAKVTFGDPRFVDEHSINVEGKTYSAKNWVIATGSSPAMPPIDGLATTPFITNKEIFSLDALPKSMIVIGAGPIGIEMSQAFCRLGTQVHVVQHSDGILSKEDKDMSDVVMNTMRDEGVSFHLGSSIIGIKDVGNEREVTFKRKDGQTTALRAETLLVAVGRHPNVAGLGLEEIGVDFDGKGLKLDKRLRTSQKHIFGAGDVTGEYIFTHAAGYEGGVVVSNAIFHLPRSVDYTWLPWCTYTEPELASIGMNEKAAKKAGIPYSVLVEAFTGNDRSLAEGEAEGKIKLILDEKEKPLGIQIVGLHAGELVSEWVAVLNGKVKLATLAAAIHPYPTLGEINKKVAGSLFASKIFSDKVRKGLKFFFSLRGRACGEERSGRNAEKS